MAHAGLRSVLTAAPRETLRADGKRGCPHYERSAQLKCPACNMYATCRVCHDEAAEGTDGHKLDRFAVVAVGCMACGAETSPGRDCGRVAPDSPALSAPRVACTQRTPTFSTATGAASVAAGSAKTSRTATPVACAGRPPSWRRRGRAGPRHECAHAHTWRLGGRAAFWASPAHHCLGPGKTCAVCCEEMPQSRSGVVQLPLCDHMMHEACRAECLRAGHTRCPLCRKSICDLSALWVSYDSAVAAAGDYVAAVPGTQSVACLDCGAVQTTPIHPRHLKCETCASYNTEVRGRTLVPPMTDAEAPPVLSVGHVMSDLARPAHRRRAPRRSPGGRSPGRDAWRQRAGRGSEPRYARAGSHHPYHLRRRFRRRSRQWNAARPRATPLGRV